MSMLARMSAALPSLHWRPRQRNAVHAVREDPTVELVWSFTNGAERRERAVGWGTRSCSWMAVSVTPQGKLAELTFAESFRPEYF